MKKLILLVFFIMGCLPSQPARQSTIPNMHSPEARLYSRICGKCHAVPEPKHFASSKWEPMVAIMESRGVALGFRPLTDKEREIILSYLKKYAQVDIRFLNSPEAKLFISRCGVCHSVPDPKKYKYSQWLKILTKMQGKIKKQKGMESLKGWEKNYILSYLRKHVREIIRVEGMDTPEARTYAKKCSACHTLKDPSIFSYNNWKDEIMPEMEEIMADENKEPLTDTERKEILAFLKKRAKPE